MAKKKEVIKEVKPKFLLNVEEMATKMLTEMLKKREEKKEE